MDTDSQLALLLSEFPNKSLDLLLDSLVAAGGDIDEARKALRSKKRRVESIGEWLKPRPGGAAPFTSAQRNLAPAEDVSPKLTSIPKTRSAGSPTRKPINVDSPTRKSINEVLRRDTTESTPVNLPPLTLATPEAVARNLPCTLLINALPVELASDLFLEMMDESEHWSRNKWYMVDREVESPHLTSFYATDEIAKEAAQHWYAGRRTAPSRHFTPLMLQVKEIVEAQVQDALSKRRRDPLEYAGGWRANVSAANRYYGRSSNVGFHADQLTCVQTSMFIVAAQPQSSYLGPAPTIASVSLGCQRTFRLRGGSPARTYNIPLPHNSLLLMHAGCQERFKHSIPPANALDVFKPVTDLQRRSFGDRINLTYRFYRPDFASPPVCDCGVPCLLRSDLKHNVKLEEDAPCRYFWQCQAGAQNQGKTCGKWTEMQ